MSIFLIKNNVIEDIIVLYIQEILKQFDKDISIKQLFLLIHKTIQFSNYYDKLILV